MRAAAVSTFLGLTAIGLCACTTRNPLFHGGGEPDGAALDPAPADAAGSGPEDPRRGPADVAGPVPADAPAAELPAPDVFAPAGPDAPAAVDAPWKRGLKAEYFPGRSFEVAPLLVTVEPNIDNLWQNRSPYPGTVPVDNFCVRWRAKLIPPVTGSYTFKTVTDDGVRLFLNGEKLIESWMLQSGLPNTATRVLDGGQLYDLEMNHFEQEYTATARLFWTGPGIAEQIIPADRFSHP